MVSRSDAVVQTLESRRPAGRVRSVGYLLGLAGAIACLALTPRPALGWGRMAHRASARLTEMRLTPEARAAIKELLEPGESLADASTWADENSREIPGSAQWHFVNVPISAAHFTARDCHGNCVVSRFEEFRRILSDRSAPKPRRRMALRYVVHLLQDAHQPMHVGDRRDRGGNSVQLQFFDDPTTNLHQVWDSGLLRVRYRRENELVDELLTMARKPDAVGWSRGGIEAWVDESLEAARQAYRVPGSEAFLRSGMRIGREYEDANVPTAVRRLAQAGVRLSDVLNDALGTSSQGKGIPAPHFRQETRPSTRNLPASQRPRS